MREWVMCIITCTAVLILLLALLFPKKFAQMMIPDVRTIYQEPTAAELKDFLKIKKLGVIPRDDGVYEVEYGSSTYIIVVVASSATITTKPK